MTHQEELEARFNTGHLPRHVRDRLYQHAYDEGHAYGMGEVALQYDVQADAILEAFDAGKAERTRTAAENIRAWATNMDTPEWREGWQQSIEAARAFAQQIESGSL